jgi:hypothetical protein
VPGLQSLRAADRFWVVGVLGLGVLAALGACKLVVRLASPPGAARVRRALPVAATVALVAVMVAEGYRPSELVEVRTRPVDAAIGDLPPGGVVYLPLNHSTTLDVSLFQQSEYVYRSTAHHRPVVNGKGSFFPPTYMAMSNQIRTLPMLAARACLLRHGIRYIVGDASHEGHGVVPPA